MLARKTYGRRRSSGRSTGSKSAKTLSCVSSVSRVLTSSAPYIPAQRKVLPGRRSSPDVSTPCDRINSRSPALKSSPTTATMPAGVK